MADTSSSFSNLVPGFDFLQGLVKNASAALPAMGQWVAPTLNPEELEKRIQELKTVQFWLEQNARMLGATIQALEVQRMTLSTLKTMNVQMGDLRDAMTIRMPKMPAAPPKAAPAPEPEPELEAEEAEAEAPAAEASAPAAGAAPTAGVVDPMKWWGALTKQFTELAASAMKEGATSAASGLAGVIAKQSFPGAGKASKTSKADAPARKAAAKRKPAARKRAAASR